MPVSKPEDRSRRAVIMAAGAAAVVMPMAAAGAAGHVGGAVEPAHPDRLGKPFAALSLCALRWLGFSSACPGHVFVQRNVSIAQVVHCALKSDWASRWVSSK